MFPNIIVKQRAQLISYVNGGAFNFDCHGVRPAIWITVGN